MPHVNASRSTSRTTLEIRSLPDIEARYSYLVRAETSDGREIRPLARPTMLKAEITSALLKDLDYLNVRIRPVPRS